MPLDVQNRAVRYDFSLLSDYDLHLFNEGNHNSLHDKLGAHLAQAGGQHGTYFAVWAPDAYSVAVIGDFNGWNKDSHYLRPRDHSGIWEGFIPEVSHGTVYKYHVASRYQGYSVDKADPYAFENEVPPRTASVVWDINYNWGDHGWMQSRQHHNSLNRPISIYEVHLGSWMRVPEDGNRWLTYRELAPKLAEYLNRMGFTHVEFMPVMEHPFYGSWGYQVTGFFAPTSRYGTPQDFMYLVDHLHQHGVGVILDWVPSHFPSDAHGLAYFDGTHLYEHSDPRQGFHPEWSSHIFNYGRNEVRSFLLSSAMFWLDHYHADGLRVDAVASMLYLDYARPQGEWIPNRYGGNENLEAISYLQKLNADVYGRHPDVQTIAEESTAWPMVSRPTYVGGLGFGLKWDMGWMHDTLKYLSKDPIHRRFHHNQLTFRGLYMFTENYVLPLSHDEVVHGKGALIGKMPGDEWQQFANLRLLFGYQWAQPGKKLLFMGGEFGQKCEWHHEESLEWWVLQFPWHSGVQKLVADLNRVYREQPALHEREFDPATFEWVDANDADSSVLSFLRRGYNDVILVVGNFTPVMRKAHRIGVPEGGWWRELLNSDSEIYGGSNQGNAGGVMAEPIAHHGRPFSVKLTLPPLGILFLKLER
ncbi:MAG TPA: 1,4-alpha-glucan branching protein GlgB [Terriglobales bacterium]|nr:1,4-alpha-glucan branching protein GlgB [Terriglobales bacterium]